MNHTTIQETLTEDQWFIDNTDFRQFVTIVHEISSRTNSDRAETLSLLEPYFSQLLTKQDWLPERFTQPNPDSRMGGSIGQWLLYRSKDRSLSVFSLVIPPGSTTPVYDHLAWGLVGLYKGKQEEIIYHRVDSGDVEGQAKLEIAQVRQLRVGDICKLLSPDDYIHAVKTTTIFAPSVSIHVIGNDTGCILRHQFDLEQGSVRDFRSGYSNVFCN